VILQHRFLEEIPADKEPGILYISLEFAVASHLCPCGCGNLIVTRLAPHGWTLSFNGETVSLSPSIGNWDLPCRSHYWIKNDEVRWARPFSDREIVSVKARDEKAHRLSGEKKSKKGRAK
jgi:hypothetical protein